VLEHIPHIDAVLKETARVLQPNAPFYFCVPNPRYFSALSLTKIFGKPYENWFRKISRVHHADEPNVWEKRLNDAGFTLERWWHYFSPASMRVLEWGHYFGCLLLVAKAITGKWIISPTKWNLSLTEAYVKNTPHPNPLRMGRSRFILPENDNSIFEYRKPNIGSSPCPSTKTTSPPTPTPISPSPNTACIGGRTDSLPCWRGVTGGAERVCWRWGQAWGISSGSCRRSFEAYGMDLNHWAVNRSKEAAEARIPANRIRARIAVSRRRVQHRHHQTHRGASA
jgi:hypothetical protein